LKKLAALGSELQVEFVLHLCLQFSHQASSLLAEINNRNHILSIVDQPKKLSTIRIKRGSINFVSRTTNVFYLMFVMTETPIIFFNRKNIFRPLTRTHDDGVYSTEEVAAIGTVLATAREATQNPEK